MFLYPSFSFSQDFESLYNLNKKKDFFVFRDKVKYYTNSENLWQEIFLNAIENNIFGDFESSNNRMEVLLQKYFSSLPDSILTDIYEIKASNHINLFEYKKAYETALLLNSGYSCYLDSDKRDDIENELIIWKALQNVPPQKLIKEGVISIPLKKDLAEMWNIPVKIKDKNYDFVFDTGANFCVIMESLARKLGFEIIENSKLKVGTSTDKKVESKIAISKQMKIGSIIIENVIFIVLPDEALNFGNYRIDGIIGNPIMKAFGELIIKNDNELVIPEQPEKSDLKNLAFDGFTPIIQMVYNNDSLNFIFDTGGQETYLYNPFFLKYKNNISKNCKITKIKIGGAGGSVDVSGYILDKLILNSGYSKFELKKVKLITDKIRDFDEYFHGHLGQNFYGNFSTIKINYSEMYIEFIK